MNNLHDNNLFQLIVESSNEGVWVIDKNELTVFVNPKMAEMLEYEPYEMVGKVLFDFMDDEGKEVALKNLSKRKNGIKENHEFLLRTKSGLPLWTEMKSSPIIISDKYQGALAFVSDITDRKRTESEQLEILSNYYSLFEDSPIPIWDEDFSEVKNELDLLKSSGVEDPRLYFSTFPEEMTRIASKLVVNKINMAVVKLNEGSTKEEILANFKSLVTPKSFEYALRQIEAIWNNQQVCEFDAELKTFKDNYRYVHFKWTVVKGHEKDYKRVFLTTTDLTERIKEENLHLQKANREKAVLLKEVHHRVKNNLQIISSLLKLQSYTTDDPKVAEMVEISLSRISSMAKVHELLYKSTEFSKINYHDYLKTLIGSLISTLSEKHQAIELQIDVDGIEFDIDTAIPLGLLINEIITNSIKHAFKEKDSGKIYIQIKALEGNDYTMFIGDNGIGLSAEISEKKDSLGMSLIRSLTEQLSGTLIQETKNQGTHYQINFKALK